MCCSYEDTVWKVIDKDNMSKSLKWKFFLYSMTIKLMFKLKGKTC